MKDAEFVRAGSKHLAFAAGNETPASRAIRLTKPNSDGINNMAIDTKSFVG